MAGKSGRLFLSRIESKSASCSATVIQAPWYGVPAFHCSVASENTRGAPSSTMSAAATAPTECMRKMLTAAVFHDESLHRPLALDGGSLWQEGSFCC